MAVVIHAQEVFEVGVDIAGESALECDGIGAVEAFGKRCSRERPALQGLEGHGGYLFASGVLGEDDFEGDSGLDQGGFDVLGADVDTYDCRRSGGGRGEEEDEAE